MTNLQIAAPDRRRAPDPIVLRQSRGGLRSSSEIKPASPQRLARQIRAKNAVRYRLRHPDGAYVNLDLSGETSVDAYGWIGFLHQLEAVRRSRPDLAEYRSIAVLPQRDGLSLQVTLGAGAGVMS